MGFIDALTSVAEPRRLDDCDEWCVGLPLVSIRILDRCEQDTLHAQVNEQFARQQAASISFAIIFVAVYITTILFPSPSAFWITAASASLIGMFVVWLLCDPESWLRRYRLLQADFSVGVVHRFYNSDCDGDLEVLPRSELVYLANNVSPRKWRRAPIIAIAKTPPIASMAIDWLQPIQGPVGRFFSGKRALSMAEREEIRRWASLIIDERLRHSVNYVCWAAMLGILSKSGSPDLFYAALAFTGYIGTRMLQDIQSVLALNKDADFGVVVINQRAKMTDGALTPIGSPSEFLPKAKLKWTEDGAAADWRKLF